MSLLSLPFELLNQICSCVSNKHHETFNKSSLPVPTKEQVAALNSISLSCKHLSCLRPHLYRCISTDQCDVYLLLRSFTDNPSLALYVKSFTFGAGRRYDSKKVYTLLRKSDVLPASCISALRLEDKTETDVALLETILLQCLKLEELCVDLTRFPDDVCFFDSRRWSDRFWQQTLHKLPTLSFCQVYIPNERRWMSPMIAQTQRLLQASAVSDLYLHLYDILKMEDVNVSLPNLTTLDIFCYGMTIADFRALVACCPNLSCLCYNAYTSPDERALGDHDLITPRKIIESIMPLAKPLTKLKVLLRRMFEEDESVRSDENLPSLQPFTELRYLELDFLSCLDAFGASAIDDFGHKCQEPQLLGQLPPRIDTLHIQGPDSRVIPELMRIPDWKVQNSSSLTCVELSFFGYPEADSEIDGRRYGFIDPEGQLSELDNVLADVGVELLTRYDGSLNQGL